MTIHKLAAIITFMKASDLNKLFKGVVDGNELSVLLEAEVNNYHRLLNKKGSTIPLIFQEDEDILINKNALNRLLKETLEARLSNVELAYICDCLTLGERVNYKDEEVKDIVLDLAGPEINGGHRTLDNIRNLFNQTTEY